LGFNTYDLIAILVVNGAICLMIEEPTFKDLFNIELSKKTLDFYDLTPGQLQLDHSGWIGATHVFSVKR